MNIEQATTILEQSKAKKACVGNYKKAAKYLTKGDLMGFEEVCRGNRGWLKDSYINYTMTDGRATSWRDNGQLASESNYKDGNLDGTYKLWHVNGQLCEEFSYKDGNLDGTYKFWHANGQLREECFYKDGKLI